MSSTVKDILGIVMVMSFLSLLFTIFTVWIIKWADTNSVGDCAYCNNQISESADIVRCSDGRRFHAECYLQYLRGEANEIS